MNRKIQTGRNRNGAVAALLALLLVPMLALVALCVDYGYLLVVKTDLQRAADVAALAAVRELVPTPDGQQDLDRVRSTAREYVNNNFGTFEIRDEDIEIGRFDPSTIYDQVDLLDDGIRDSVRITLRRDSVSNSSVSLFFARIIGITESDVTATSTAVLQKARDLGPGADILPIAIPLGAWSSQDPGQEWSIYGDGKITDESGNTVPGNFGTLDIGPSNNSTSDLRDQINNGLSQSDLDALYGQNRIRNSTHIGATEQFWANADPGLSAGMKSAVIANHGNTKLIPIVNGMNNGNGNNLEYVVVGWGVARIVDSNWSGGPTNRYLNVQKAYMYDRDLWANPDLSDTTNIISGAFTTPVLVE